MAATDDLFGGAPRRQVVSVAVPVALERTYSYRVPHGASVAPGSIVEVPLGPRKVTGVVWDDDGEALKIGDNRLREIETVHNAPPIDATLRKFVDWVARYYLMPRGMVLRMVLRAPEALEPEAPIRGVRLAGPVPERMTDARRRVLERLEDGFAWSRAGLVASVGVSASVVDGLVASGTLEEVMLEPGRLREEPDPDHAPVALNDDQDAAAETLRAAVAGAKFGVFLLDGVTGSGKTEVYFEAAAKAFDMGRQVLILLPEIALTAQFIERFTRRFGVRPGEWHSDVTPKNRARLWRGVATGEVQCVVGARSALYLPFKDLGLIVIDEEHDSAFKQAEGVVYHARDMAVVRGSLAKAAVVLSSATPSIESRVNADQGRYTRIVMPNRIGGARMPEIEIVDLRRQMPPKGRYVSPIIVESLAAALGRGEQGLLFLNRRGYAPLTVCRTCGHRYECPNCSTWLVEHRFRGVLACHHCGHTIRRPDHCTECGEVDSLVACGPGVERIAEEAAALFPDARRLVLSSDLPGGTKRMREELEVIARGEVDLVIGTQLIAKGHNFPGMTVVGVVDADLGLSHGDPRAAEKTFQLLQQVTGRAGRTGTAARGILQSHAPGHPIIRAIASGDSESFYAHEIAERRMTGMPPFGRLAALVITGETRDQAADYARNLARVAPKADDVDVLGPAEAPIAVIRGRHRFRLLVRTARHVDLQAYLVAWLQLAAPPKGGVELRIDIDPQSFL